MRYGKTVFNAVGRARQESIDAEVKAIAINSAGLLSDLDVANKLMIDNGYRIEWHNVSGDPWNQAEGIEWQGDVHTPAGV